jgi:hypothetical protein
MCCAHRRVKYAYITYLQTASLGNRAPAVLSQAGAPLSWTSDCERGRQRLTSASLSERSEQFTWSERSVLPLRATTK